MKLSVVVPVYNEERNVLILYNEIKASLNSLNKKHEIIFIDDGSKDRSFRELLKISNADKNVKIIKFRKNFGQTAAMNAGFKHSSGEIIIALDADLQNDPADFKKLLDK